nr:MAG TPA: hypothetical protein [Bacteriophage sp.]
MIKTWTGIEFILIYANKITLRQLFRGCLFCAFQGLI